MSSQTPTSVSTTVHGLGQMEADASPGNNGCVHLTGWRNGWETFDIAIVTSNATMSQELADAINGVLARHGRLHPESKHATTATKVAA